MNVMPELMVIGNQNTVGNNEGLRGIAVFSSKEGVKCPQCISLKDAWGHFNSSLELLKGSDRCLELR